MSAIHRNRRRVARQILPLLLAALAISVISGCGQGAPPSPPLKTWPVHGQLLDRADRPVSSGVIELVSEGSKPRLANGDVQADGKFELSASNTSGQRFSGAEAGTYRATYIPLMSAEQTETPYTWPDPIQIESRDNQLRLKLP